MKPKQTGLGTDWSAPVDRAGMVGAAKEGSVVRKSIKEGIAKLDWEKIAGMQQCREGTDIKAQCRCIADEGAQEKQQQLTGINAAE